MNGQKTISASQQLLDRRAAVVPRGIPLVTSATVDSAFGAIGAVMGRADVIDGARPGAIGGTYGGNPLACAAALATLGLMEELQLAARAGDWSACDRAFSTASAAISAVGG